MTRSDSRKALGKGLHSLLPARPPQNPLNTPAVHPSAEGQQPAPADERAAAERAPAELPAREHPAGERILKIPTTKLHPNPHQPRSNFNEAALLDLTTSIGRDGILQPIIARRAGPDEYEIIAGERRWRAAKACGLPEIPVILRQADENRALELALIENIPREDLNPMELARAFERMVQLGLRHDEIGAKTGKDRVTITNALRLLQLPKAVQTLVAERRISSGHARALLKIEGDFERGEAAERCMREGWSVRQIEEFTRSPKSARTPETGAPDKKPPQIDPKQTDPNVRAVQEELQEIFGTRVRIVSRGKGKGQIEFDYYSEEDLQRLYEAMSARQS
jgi:ParB family transcriptional regulator, chromosome partitioning protein